MTEPSLRKPLGMLGILAWIALWSVVALMFSGLVLGRAWPIQLAYYAIIGIVWIAPLKPVLRWMETGRLR